MSSSKEIDLKRDFAADVYLYEAQTHTPSPLNTVYVYRRQYTVLIHTGRGGRGELKHRES